MVRFRIVRMMSQTRIIARVVFVVMKATTEGRPRADINTIKQE